MARDTRHAREWLLSAVKLEDVPARVFLRQVTFEERFKIRSLWKDVALVVIGYASLAHYVWMHGLSFSITGLLLYLGVFALAVLVTSLLLRVDRDETAEEALKISTSTPNAALRLLLVPA